AVLARAGLATGAPPSPDPEHPAPTRAARLWWLATAGTGWVARRCTDLLPGLLRLAAEEVRHGTGAELDARASAETAGALAALVPPRPVFTTRPGIRRVPVGRPDSDTVHPARSPAP
ncbi:SGNH/GDSL hydrolase family protein, partial [Streptomyces sp. SID4985]|nr:SGNH/GDSL hydrolase family protein [Streptomyces sp. SID4985]